MYKKQKTIHLSNMIFSRNIIFIIFLLTFLDSMMSVYSITKCEKNILKDFDYLEKNPIDMRFYMPRRAFLRLTINDLTNEDANNYFEHLYLFIEHKENMLLPREFCDVRTKSFKLLVNGSSDEEYEKCVTLLLSTFKDMNDKTELIKFSFWNFTESAFSKFGKKDYRYMYFYYLSGKFIYPHTLNQKFPKTLREFCATLYPDKYINLMSRDVSEFTREEAKQYCLTKIYNDFNITTVWKQLKSRKYFPKAAFLTFVEDDLESTDAKDYYYHVHGVIKAKNGTTNPRKYCKIITKGIEEEKKCVEHLLLTYLDSDATTVLKDAFQNLKESYFVETNEFDYRSAYFHYLSGSYDFYKIEKFRDTPLTPLEFCAMNRTEALNTRMIIMESGSMSGEGTLSSTSRQT